MKIKSFLMCVAVALCVMACEKEEKVSDSVKLAGTYQGYSDADCSIFQDKYTDGEQLLITDNADGTLCIEFKSLTWGTFRVDPVKLTHVGKEYILAGKGKVSMGMGPSVGEYDFTLSGKMDTDKKNFSFLFDVPAVMGGLKITLLSGTAPVQ